MAALKSWRCSRPDRPTTHRAPPAVQMAESIALDKKRILPCAAWLQGEYGLRDVFCGVPCKLGRKGLEQIVTVTLSDQEKTDLHKSAAAVMDTMKALG